MVPASSGNFRGARHNPVAFFGANVDRDLVLLPECEDLAAPANIESVAVTAAAVWCSWVTYFDTTRRSINHGPHVDVMNLIGSGNVLGGNAAGFLGKKHKD